MFWIKFIRGIITALHSEDSPAQIGWGVALGSIIGLTPFTCLHNFFILLLIFIFPVNIGAAFLSMIIFKSVGLFTDPAAHLIGYYFLVKAEFLYPVWVYLYNLPIIPYTRFNNTVVLGNFIISLILFLPVYFSTVKLVNLYRQHWQARVEKWKIMKWMKLSGIYNLYQRFRG